MSEYVPDRWVMIKISQQDKPPVYKILAGWYGSYLYGSSWKINSGVTKAVRHEDGWSFHGSSGSVYVCINDRHGLTGWTSSILNDFTDAAKEKNTVVETVPEETDYLTIDYGE